VVVNLLESNPRNVGHDKEYVGVPGNLFAFAAKRSFESGDEGFVVFVAKTALIRDYEQTLGNVPTSRYHHGQRVPRK